MSFSLEMRGLAKDATLYGLPSAFARMISLFMAPILTRIFLPEDYGVIALIQLAVSFLVMIAGMNIGSGMSYYYFKNDNAEDRKMTLTTGFVVVILLSALIASLLAVFSEQAAALLQFRVEGPIRDHDLAAYLRIAALGLFFSLMMSGVQSIIRLLRQPKQFLKVQVTAILAQVITVLILVVWLRTGVAGVFWAGVLSPLMGFMLGIFFVADQFGRKLSVPVLALILGYSLPQLPGVMINWTQTQLGRVLLNHYASLTELGLYSIAFTVASVLFLGTTAFRMAYDPYSLSIMKRDDCKETYARVYSLYGVAFCCLFGWIGAFAKPILVILTPPAYHEAHSLVIIFLAAGFYMGANNILATGIWISKKTSHTSYAQMIAFAVLLTVSLTLIPRYGGEGAAIAYLCGTITQSLAYYFFAQKLWPVPYQYWKTHGLVALIFCICLLHNQLVENLNLAYSLLLAATTSCIIAAIGWGIGVSPLEKEKALQFFRSRLLRTSN